MDDEDVPSAVAGAEEESPELEASTTRNAVASRPLTLHYDLFVNLLTYASVFIVGYLVRRVYLSRGGSSYGSSGTRIEAID